MFDALIVGGEDCKTGHEDHVEAHWQCVEEWARERWSMAREIIYIWTGQVFRGNDFFAFIGPNPDGPKNVNIATGDLGHGIIAHGTIAEMLLTDPINGKPNDWKSAYDPHRVSLCAPPIAKFVKENADIARHRWSR